MYHTASSYKVRINEETLSHMSNLLQKTDSVSLSKEEKFLLDKLLEKKMLVAAAEKTRLPPVKNKSRLDSIELEFSSACNLKCRHCFASLSGRNMQPGIIGKILKGAAELDIINLVLSGGEPLLNPLFADTLQKAHEMNLKIIVMTNGADVADETAKIMAENKVAETVVSLDFFKQHHDEIRGEGSFDKTIKGIRTFKKYGLSVYVTAVACDKSVPFIEDFKKFCLRELGISQIRLSAAIPVGRASDPPALKDFYISDENLKKIFSEECLQEQSGKGKTGESELRGFPCAACTGQLFVSAEGIVYPCRYFQNLNEPVGSLDGIELAKIYEKACKHGPTALFKPAEMKTCVSCESFAACRGGCRARAKLLTGDVYGPDPFKCRTYGKNFKYYT